MLSEQESKNQSSSSSIPKKWILMFSGKRASGKNYCADCTYKHLTEKCHFNVKQMAFADSLKKMFAEHKQLDYERLLSDREYKETYRDEMTNFYLGTKEQDPLQFCKRVFQDTLTFFTEAANEPAVVIVSDLRHQFEADFFKQNVSSLPFPHCRLMCIRVEATTEAKLTRGWTPGPIDQSITECDLDSYQGWDCVFDCSQFGAKFPVSSLDESFQ
eukprot:TRINITY_DN387_c0_g1_i2.p1 TRINITY_DN387_c0_g1~~TRINITY_DN387_c0_g1_i2.p1  ORF type:complete len:215 (-),score=10.23 TRINITY_DN387_c0_g1_i2:95-739(-)